MLDGRGRVRCAVCADESFSYKNISGSRSGGRCNLDVCVVPQWVDPERFWLSDVGLKPTEKAESEK